MANPEHLAILQKGVQAWNRWRSAHQGISPDLSNADLGGSNLLGAKRSGNGTFQRIRFVRINLSQANLSGANLRRANLMKAALDRAHLEGANLDGAAINEANLTQANLNRTTLIGADLNRVTLIAADLKGATLSGAKLTHAYLMGVALSHANLSNAFLRGANLDAADLVGANLCGADLVETNLNNGDLSGADLQDADVRFSQLCRCNLTRARLTGAKLYATARDDWIVEGAECRYVFWDECGTIRSPRDRDLTPGEFEQLYRALPTIEYVFHSGLSPIDLVAMNRVVEVIQEKYPTFGLNVDSISLRGLTPSVRFTVLLDEYRKAALAAIKKEYETRVKRLRAERDKYWDAITRAMEAPKRIKLIAAAPGSIVGNDGATINITQHVHHAVELQRVVSKQPQNSETFGKVAKHKVMDVIGGAIQDFAKGKVREAAAVIVDICKDLGPVIVNTAAYAFFKTYLGQ
ncbi:MAG: pentapeptide repeat-containing protein [Sedimentisphaerales bacterium]|nr:pentapeptide repeat-containing protein [Sedimentisphaerales bacterium]